MTGANTISPKSRNQEYRDILHRWNEYYKTYDILPLHRFLLSIGITPTKIAEILSVTVPALYVRFPEVYGGKKQTV